MKITVIDAKTRPFQERVGRKIQVLFDGAAPDASQIQLMTVEYPRAKARVGGERGPQPHGYYVQPTVFTGVHNEMTIAHFNCGRSPCAGASTARSGAAL